ncbi:MAG TPA: hypothetical protein VGK73_05890 [Polyangiaceae bacterium]
MRFSFLTLGLSSAFATACSGSQQARPNEATPGIVVPVPLADGPEQGAQGSSPRRNAKAPPPAASAAPASPAPKAGSSAPPDPEALRTRDQVEYTLVYEKGQVRVGSVRRLLFLQPVVTARKMGRYAVELWVGRELLERVRFDFPMLAAEEPDVGQPRPLREPPPLTKGPIEATVLVPFSARARRAVLLDRATGTELELTWPPVVTPAPEPVPAPAAAPPAAPPA